MQVSEASSTDSQSRYSIAAGARPSASRFHLAGPSVVLDPRVNAVRRDIADISLADQVFAPHYAAPETLNCVARSCMLRASPDRAAAAVSQLTFGEAFAVVDQSGEWAWGYGLHDRYVGYVPADALGSIHSASHHIIAPSAPVFTAADIKSPVVDFLSIGARIDGTPSGAFLTTSAGFIHHRHVRGIDNVEPDVVSVAERMIGAPYLWGGRGDGGIDCSGLVQRALGLAGIDCPRDSDQQAMLGREISPDEPTVRGDIILFAGHVGMMVDATRLIHANAHWMAVTIEPLATVVARGAAIVARRRILP